MSGTNDARKTIVIRDRRKPNQYTTDNVIAREWLPILRIGDAFFFYSVYLSMANRETESSWSSLRTLARYLQCGVDLIIRGNKLLEICELIHVETGNYRTSNEYYILDPPPLTPELTERIQRRLEDIDLEETSKNWQAWVRQVRKALTHHNSLPSIWAERRAKREKAIKTVHPQAPDCESQPGSLGRGDCGSQPHSTWTTTAPHVAHAQSARESQPKQEQQTRDLEEEEKKEHLFDLVQARCLDLDMAPQVTEILLSQYALEDITRQLEWLPFRNARDPAAMLVSAIKGDWTPPDQYVPENPQGTWQAWLSKEPASNERADQDLPIREKDLARSFSRMANTDLDANEIWTRVLKELSMQMTRATFDTWLNGSEVVEVGDATLVVRVRDEYAVDWLRTRWLAPVQRTLNGVVGYDISIRFVA